MLASKSSSLLASKRGEIEMCNGPSCELRSSSLCFIRMCCLSPFSHIHIGHTWFHWRSEVRASAASWQWTPLSSWHFAEELRDLASSWWPPGSQPCSWCPERRWRRDQWRRRSWRHGPDWPAPGRSPGTWRAGVSQLSPHQPFWSYFWTTEGAKKSHMLLLPRFKYITPIYIFLVVLFSVCINFIESAFVAYNDNLYLFSCSILCVHKFYRKRLCCL